MEAGANPGGVIFHVYEVPSGRLLHVSAVAPGTPDAIAQTAEADALAALDLTGAEVCLVAYDGDTGHRYTAWEMAAVLMGWGPK